MSLLFLTIYLFIGTIFELRINNSQLLFQFQYYRFQLRTIMQLSPTRVEQAQTYQTHSQHTQKQQYFSAHNLMSHSQKLYHLRNLQKEQLIQKIIVLETLNNQIGSNMQMSEKQASKKIQNMKIGFSESFLQYRLTTNNHMEVYIQKLNLYEQEKSILQKKLLLSAKQSENKDMKIIALQKALSIFLDQQTAKQQHNIVSLEPIKGEKQLKNGNQKPILNKMEQMISKIVKAEECMSEQSDKINTITSQIQGKRQQIQALTHEILLLKKQVNSLNIQLLFYKEQVEEKTKQIQQRDIAIENMKQQLRIRQIDEQTRKEQKNSSMAYELTTLREQLKNCKQELYKKQQQIKFWEQNFHQKSQDSKQNIQKLHWYEQLLNQAKSNFVYSELKNQQKLNMLKKQNIQLKKQLIKFKQMDNSHEISIIDNHLNSTHRQNNKSQLLIRHTQKHKQNDRNMGNLKIKMKRMEDDRKGIGSTKSLFAKNYSSARIWQNASILGKGDKADNLEDRSMSSQQEQQWNPLCIREQQMSKRFLLQAQSWGNEILAAKQQSRKSSRCEHEHEHGYGNELKNTGKVCMDTKMKMGSKMGSRKVENGAKYRV